MPTKISLLVTTVAFFSVLDTAFARELTYNNFSINYSTFEDTVLGIDLDGDGFGFSGSFEINEDLAFIVGYSSLETDPILGISIAQTALTFGIAAHTPVSKNTDLVGSFAILNVDSDVEDNGRVVFSDDDSGNVIGVGIRNLVSDDVEINVQISRADVYDDTSNTTGIGARIYSSDETAFTVNFSTGDDADTWTFGLIVEL